MSERNLSEYRDLGSTFFDNDERLKVVEACRDAGHTQINQRTSRTATRVICDECKYRYEWYHGD